MRTSKESRHIAANERVLYTEKVANMFQHVKTCVSNTVLMLNVVLVARMKFWNVIQSTKTCTSSVEGVHIWLYYLNSTQQVVIK